MKNTSKIAIAIAVLCSSGAALAQDYNPSWYIAPSFNIMDQDDAYGVDKRGRGAGFRLGKPLSQAWDLQFGGSYSRAKEGAERYNQTTLGADALYMFSRKTFRPFVLVGVGAERDKLESPGRNASRTSPYVSAGIGFQMAFNEQWSMQADLRRVHGRLRGNDFPFDRSNNNYLTIGVNYAFDKPASAPVAAPMPEPVAQVEPAPAPTPAPAPPPKFEKVTMSATELFAFNSAKLNDPQPKLDEIASALSADLKIDNVVITGYADRLGSDKYNLKLSEQRANSVKAYLVSKGVTATRLSAVGKGEANPVVQCNDKKRAALIKCLEPNRRVEVEQITIERQVP